MPPTIAPPPPMMPMEKSVRSAPMPQTVDPRGALLESIRKGKSLKKVDPLEERPVTSTCISNDKPNANDLAKSLNDFLDARKGKIRESDSESEDDDSDEWDD